MVNPKVIKKAKDIIGQFLADDIQKHGGVMPVAKKAGISRRIIYNIQSGEGYTIDSLLAVLAALDKRLEIKDKLIEPEQSN